MANNRLFYDRKIESMKEYNTNYFRHYISYMNKVLGYLDATVKMKDIGYQEKFKMYRESLKNTALFNAHSKLAQEFDAIHTNFESEKKNGHIAIPSRFETTELFYEEINKIRNITGGEECNEYMTRAFNTLFADPTSPFITPLCLEVYIRHEQLLLQYGANCELRKVVIGDEIDELNEKMESMQISTKANSQQNQQTLPPKTIEYHFLERYSEFLKHLFAAHCIALPAIVEVINDNIPGVGFVNRYTR